MMFALRTTLALSVLIACTAVNPDPLANGLVWVVVPGLILVCVLDYVEMGNAVPPRNQ